MLLFAVLIPALWRSLTRQRVSGGRWLLLVLLAFAFWRDHFSFTTTDVPALALLLLALWAVGRAGGGWWLVAGLSLAAALNSRPVYLAAVLPVLLLAWGGSRVLGARRAGWSWLALLLGAGVVLGPQWLINRRHFASNSPLVLAQVSATEHVPLYLKQLTWGTRVLRYDTDLRQRLIYADSAGLAVLRREGIREYTSYGQFLGIVLRHPLDYGWRYFRHLFNGLDVWQPAPYLLRAYGPEQPWLQLVNYSVLGMGLSVLLTRPAPWLRGPRGGALLALLLPCLVAVPTAIECRFLLPLHLLLLTVAAFRFRPWRWLDAMRSRPVRVLPGLVVVGLWWGGCFWLSHATARNLLPDHGKSLVDD